MSNLSAVANNSGKNAVSAVQTPAAAGTVTPDLSVADHWVITMPAGNITVANPINVPGAGCDLFLDFTQDATGSRTVTFGSAFKGGLSPVSTASKRSVQHFRYDGTSWVNVAGQTAGF